MLLWGAPVRPNRRARESVKARLVGIDWSLPRDGFYETGARVLARKEPRRSAPRGPCSVRSRQNLLLAA